MGTSTIIKKGRNKKVKKALKKQNIETEIWTINL